MQRLYIFGSFIRYGIIHIFFTNINKIMTLFKNKYRVESTRLPNRDYSQNGWYFVTICTYERQWLFGDVVNSQVHLSEIGEIAAKFWAEIPQHSQNTYIDAYVIMHNHVHGIIVIDNPECRDVVIDNPGCRDVVIDNPECRDVACNVSTHYFDVEPVILRT